MVACVHYMCNKHPNIAQEKGEIRAGRGPGRDFRKSRIQITKPSIGLTS